MAVEVRYVGTQSLRNWGVEDWNDFNIYESGFLEEFKKAQSNLRATVAQGLCASSATCTFGYRGPGTGTVPLPIYLGYLNGSKDINNPCGVHGHELHEHDFHRPAQYVPAERFERRLRPAHDRAAQQRNPGRLPGEFLAHESRRRHGRGEHDDERRESVGRDQQRERHQV
jgi:hypothetical protein